jgi:hypothetical protein
MLKISKNEPIKTVLVIGYNVSYTIQRFCSNELQNQSVIHKFRRHIDIAVYGML